MGTLYPQAPMNNAGNMYINALKLTWLSNTQIAVSQGAARDSTNTVDIVLARPPLNNGQKQTAPFILDRNVQGAGGLDSGILTVATSYAIYVIYSSAYSQISTSPSPDSYLLSPPYLAPESGSPVTQSERYLQANVLMSTNFAQPVLPAGFDSFRRIGAVATKANINGSVASLDFAPFRQTGNGVDRVIYFVPRIDLGPLSGSSTFVPIGNLYPYIPITAVTLQIRTKFIPAEDLSLVDLLPGGPNQNVYTAVYGQIVGVAIIVDNVLPVGFDEGVPEILYLSSSSSDQMDFAIQAYTDSL